MNHADKGCPGLVVGRLSRAPATAGLCYGCARHGKQTVPMLPAAARLEDKGGRWVWDCQNKVPAWGEQA